MIDYTKLAARAKALIAEHGREVTFLRFSQAPGDGDLPWAGPADPRDDVDAEEVVPAVFVPPSSASRLGMGTIDADLLRRTSSICITAAANFELESAHELIDEAGVRRRILFVEKLRPNTVTLLYFVGVQR